LDYPPAPHPQTNGLIVIRYFSRLSRRSTAPHAPAPASIIPRAGSKPGGAEDAAGLDGGICVDLWNTASRGVGVRPVSVGRDVAEGMPYVTAARLAALVGLAAAAATPLWPARASVPTG